MSVKWNRNQHDSGILRKSECSEKKEELFVFGYSCKLFRDDEKALHIDQGKHLIPWMGDDTLKIDRYDARGALHDLSRLEAPPGGFDWRVELTRNELDVEQLCDEERYRALHTDEDEEEMYKEEELKRLHAAGYGQVGFNYDTPAAPATDSNAEKDEPFIIPPALKALLPEDVVLPETEKLNAIIDKTADFIAKQGAQMEILLRAKQADNPQFKFLNKDCPLHTYYMALIGLVKAGKWPEKVQEECVEEKHQENEDYLHPSLGSTIVESAPSIPSIQYKPSADCDYTLLISRLTGSQSPEQPEPVIPGEEPPPGTTPLSLPQHAPDICREPVMYNAEQQAQNHANQTYYQQYAAYYNQYMQQAQQNLEIKPDAPSGKSAGLSLMANYNTDSDSDATDSDDSSSTDTKITIKEPPDDVKVVIDKMAAYVARNGDEFADIVRAKNDPRFIFLDPSNEYHPFYLKLMREKRGVQNGDKKDKKTVAPVSFSIKKIKEPDPVLPKPALPYESSSDEEDKQENKDEGTKEEAVTNTTNIIKTPIVPVIPPVIVYKLENHINIVEKPVEPKPVEILEKPESKPVVEVKPTVEVKLKEEKKEVDLKPATPKPREKSKEKTPEIKKEREKHRDRHEYRSKSSSRDVRHDRTKKRHREEDRHRKRRKHRKVVQEIISVEEHSDELIDLTGDTSDIKVSDDVVEDKSKQTERRRRAAEFLKKVGVDPAAAALPTTSLASAMVDTLESIRKRKAEEEEKRRKKEKKRQRHDYNGDERSRKKSKRKKYDDRRRDDDDDYDSSKKKKRRKDKKIPKIKKKKRTEDSEDSVEEQLLNIDLQNTLKELRYSSPTKEMFLDEDTQTSVASKKESEKEDGKKKEKKKEKKREYSEGEWSSDSDRVSSTSADSD